MRYCPSRDFPPYAFLPGSGPHPTSDPDGHSFGVPEQPAQYFVSDAWRDNEDYLFGVDLYNHGFLWEAHEAWEGLWHAAKPDEHQARFLQGLIQCTAACLKIRMEQPRGLTRLSELGTEKMEDVARANGPEFMGIDVDSFVSKLRQFAESEPDSIEDRPRLELREE